MLDELTKEVDELIESNKLDSDYLRIGLIKQVKNHYVRGPLINLIQLFNEIDNVYVFKFEDNSESSQMRSALHKNKVKFVNLSNYIFSKPFNHNIRLDNFNINCFGSIRKANLEEKINQGLKDKSVNFNLIIDKSTNWFRALS